MGDITTTGDLVHHHDSHQGTHEGEDVHEAQAEHGELDRDQNGDRSTEGSAAITTQPADAARSRRLLSSP